MNLMTPWDTFIMTEGGVPMTLINPSVMTYDPTQDSNSFPDGPSVDVVGLYYQGGPAGRQLTGQSGTDIVYSAVVVVPIKSFNAALQDQGFWLFPLQPAKTSVSVNSIEYSVSSIRTRFWRGVVSAYEFDLGR